MQNYEKKVLPKKNGKNFGKGNYNPLELDTKKLQIKYNVLKKKWCELKDRSKKGSGLERKKHPCWLF